MRIVILTGNHLCHNPRVRKEAATLGGAGHDVKILGAWIDAELKENDRALLAGAPFAFRPVIDLTFSSGVRLMARAKAKAGAIAHGAARLESKWQLGPAVDALTNAATKENADLFIAHSEAGMVVAAQLLKNAKIVGVDMEDWFSEDLLPEARRRRPVNLLREVEKKLLQEGVHRTCTSQAMAEALAREYNCEPPIAIYNAFAWSEREKIDGLNKDRHDIGLRSIHWFSQTLGFGRGLEDLIAALPFLESKAEIHLRGKPVAGFAEWLDKQVPDDWRNRIFVHGVVPNDELLSRIAEHDMGLATEQTYCRNKIVTVSNKVLHYLLGGLAVVSSDTSGQREVADQANGAVRLYRAGDPRDLAAKLNFLLRSNDELTKAKQAALNAAQKTFCWERQASKLLRSVEDALAGKEHYRVSSPSR